MSQDITYVPELAAHKVHVLPENADGAELRRLQQQHPRHIALDPKAKAESINEAVVGSARLQFSGLTAEQYDRVFGKTAKDTNKQSTFGRRDADGEACSQE